MFITLEGIEGCGKSTQLQKIQDYLLAQNRQVTITLEPGGSRLGQELRKILLNPQNDDLHSLSELFLYLADRAQHIAGLIKPALANNHIVISDRFADSTVVYQGYGRGLDPKLLHQLNEVAIDGLWPDLTLLLDLEPEIGLKRALMRNVQENKHSTEGRFEAESLQFHTKVREGYLTWAALNKQRFAVIDASLSPDQVFAQIQPQLECLLTGDK